MSVDDPATGALRVPEAMTRFKCNERGCCCKGWQISFDADDVFDLARALPEEERKDLLVGAYVGVDEETGFATRIRLRATDAGGSCRYLQPAGQCRIHATLGPAVLPNLCRVFPAFAYATPDDDPCRAELHYDPVCPEVLARIDESDAPYAIIEVPEEQVPDMAQRAQRLTEPPAVKFGELALNMHALHQIREGIVQAFNAATRPAIDTLGQVSFAIARLARDGEAGAFELRDDEPIERYERYLDTCVASHQGALLARYFARYRRFMFEDWLPEGSWTDLETCVDYDPRWRAQIDPREPSLNGLLRRYLAHRFFHVFDEHRDGVELSFRYTAVTHGVALAFRLAVGVSRWLERPVDRAVLRVSIGASEYFFRNILPDLIRPGLPVFDPYASAD